jgi:hypothetical protein
VLLRHGIAPAPKRSQTTAWKDFFAAHMAVLAGMDFFTTDVLTWRGPATYYILLVIQLETRLVTLVGTTRHPTQEWMQQMARNLRTPMRALVGASGICFTITKEGSVTGFDQSFALEESNQQAPGEVSESERLR